MAMDFGLVTWLDGKGYKVFFDGGIYEYPIGGLACEYSRFKPYTLKNVIMKCPVFGEAPSESTIDESAKWFSDILFKEYDLVTAIMILTDLSNLIHDYLWAEDKYKKQFMDDLNEGLQDDNVKQYILENSGLDRFCLNTMGAIYLSAYASFAVSYGAFRHSLNLLANDGGEQEQVDAFFDFFGDYTEMQHIDYRLALIEGKFAEIFTIKSSLSLILFETAHVMESETAIIKCKNCGQFFVPTGRSDSIYCSYPSPQNQEKTCKDIGAQVSRSNKEKTDVATKEYRKVYMRFKMLMRRHPEETSYEEQFDRLTSEVKEWRNKLAHGMATTEEFLAWLSEFSDNKSKRIK